MYTLRVPFRLAEGKKLGKLEEGPEAAFDGLRLRLQAQSQYYVLVIEGFESEEQAQGFLSRSFGGLFWAMLLESLPFKAEEGLREVHYPEDPEQVGRNLFGREATVTVNGLIDGASPAVYRTDLRMSVMTAGNLSVTVGLSASKVLTSIRDGVAHVTEGALDNAKLRIALELYRVHFFERSSEAQLITLVMALESLAPTVRKHAAALELLQAWRGQLNDRRNDLEPGSDGYLALEALERELLFRQDASLRSQVRLFVHHTLQDAGFPDPDDRARRAVEIYDTRSTLVHDGRVDSRELHDALRDAQHLVRDVLKHTLLAG